MRKLAKCDLGVSYKCNFKCLMCNFWQDLPLDENNIMSMEHWKSVLAQIVNLPREDDFMINFAGVGECLLREGIFELIKQGRNLGLKMHLISNGYVVNKDIAKKINEAGLEFLTFSLDSLNPQTHDYLRGVPGAKDKVLEAIKFVALYSPRTKMGINAVISAVNLKEVVELAEWVENNINLSHINFQAITQPFSTTEPAQQDWFAMEKNKFLWPEDKDTMNKVIDRLIELKQRRYAIADSIEQLNNFREYFLNPLAFIKNGRCNLGKGNVLFIDPEGNLSMCPMIGKIDNAKNAKSIEDILNSSQASLHIDNINKCKTNCHLVVSCYFKEESA